MMLTSGFSQSREPVRQVFPHFIKLDRPIPMEQRAQVLDQNFNPPAGVTFEEVKVDRDALGFTHIKLQEYYQGVLVEGALVTLHARKGQIERISGNYVEVNELSVSPSITETSAFNLARNSIGAKTYMWEQSSPAQPDASRPEGVLVIFSEDIKNGLARLAYKFDIYATEPLSRSWVFVDAGTGKILAARERIHHTDVPANGISLYNGVISFTADQFAGGYRLQQTSSGSGIQTFTLSNGINYATAADITSASSTFTLNPTGVQAHYGAEQTYDYFLSNHGRNSYDGAGSVLKSYVNYDIGYVNAFWDGTRMTYGDGDGVTYGPLISLDIAGHEIAHGVTEFSANLNYSDESGALNESFSDIFGEMVEYHATGTNDWLLGVDIGIGGSGAIRSMSNPNAFNHPDTYNGLHYYVGAFDNGGVHLNSGVQNKWFYILSIGESGTNDLGNAYSVTGIGRAAADAIAYRNLTVYLSTNSGFLDARIGAIQAAIDLYGAGSPEEIATANAWYAVGVGGLYGSTTYCSAYGNSQYEWIANVSVGAFSHASGASGYSDFSAQVIPLTPGQNYPVTFTPGFAGGAYSEFWRVWIDYNADGDFDDLGELVISLATDSTSSYSGTLSVPTGLSGTTRMRVAMRFYGDPAACGSLQFGEVEDYTVDFGSITSPNYCQTAGTSFQDEWISKVSLGGVSQVSGASGYSDYTGVTIPLTPGQNYFYDIQSGFNLNANVFFPRNFKVWIDYNADGTFQEPMELAISVGNTYQASGTLTIPAGLSGTTRMRVNVSRDPGALPCGPFPFGEVEDYTVDFGTNCTGPAITCPQNLMNLSCTDNTQPVSTGTATATGGCGQVAISSSDSIAFGFCTSTYTIFRKWTATDALLNTTSCVQLIHVADIQPPVAPAAPASMTVACASDLPAPIQLTATDNCSGTITVSPTTQILPGNCLNDFTMIRTWTFTDNCGNQVDISQTIIVKDTLAPVPQSVPANLSLACAADVPPQTSLTAIDNCDGPITVFPTTSFQFGTCLNDFRMVRTWTFTDTCGNTSSVSQTIIVKDTLAPVPQSVPGNLTLQCASAVPPPTSLTAIDNCDGLMTAWPSTTFTPGACLNDFTMIRTWTFSDTCGNTSSVSQTIIVKDTLAPVPQSVPGNLTLACAADVPPPTSLTAIDNCDGLMTAWPSTTFTPGACLNDFTMIRTWTFSDTCGNTSSVSQTITVKDTVAPVLLNVPQDIVNCSGATVTVTPPTATDNCDGLVSVNTFRSDGLAFAASFPIGITTLTFVATDTCGNASSASMTVSIGAGDTTYLSATTCDSTQAGITLQTFTSQSGCDSVVITTTTYTGVPTSDFSFCKNGLGLSFSHTSAVVPTNWLWNFGDGNTSTLQNPTHTYASSGTFSVCLTTWNACGGDTSCQSIQVLSSGSAGSDNNATVCEGVVVDLTTLVNAVGGTFSDPSASGGLSGTTFNTAGLLGSYALAYTVSGGIGCQSDVAIITIEVAENLPPVLSCGSNIVIQAAPLATSAVVTFSDPGVVDECAYTLTQIAGLASGSAFPIGTTTVTFEAVDEGGQSAQCSFNVVVQPFAPEVDHFVLYDALADVALFTITDGQVINMNTLPTFHLALSAVTNPSPTGSVNLTLTGPVTGSRVENLFPYTIFGDNAINGDITGKNFQAGTYTITGKAYTGSNLSGLFGNTKSVTFTLVKQQYTVNLSSNGNGTAGISPVGPLFLAGTQVTATATPNPGYQFSSWKNAQGNVVSTANPYPFTVNANLTLVANFTPQPQYSLTIISDSTGTGTAVPSLPLYPANTSVTVTATTPSSWATVFQQWEDGAGNVVSTTNPYTFVINSNVTLKPRYQPGVVYYMVTLFTAGLGTADLNPKPGPWPGGTLLTVSATPFPGNQFLYWTGGFGGPILSTSNIYTFPVGSSTDSIVAYFAPIPMYTVSLGTNGSGTASINPAGGSYQLNTAVAVTATPDAGYTFVNWTDGSGNVVSTANPYSFAVAGNTSLVANFAQLPPPMYNVALLTLGNGTASISPINGPYTAQSMITVTATPAANSVFVNWTDDLGNLISTANPFTFQIQSNVIIRANFVLNPQAGTSITSFTLIAPNTDVDAGTINNGATISVNTPLLGGVVNVRANTAGTPIGSVKFIMTNTSGVVVQSRIENVAPYALYGDNSGDYIAKDLFNGTYELTAIPYTQPNAIGTIGTPLTVVFTIIGSDLPIVPNTLPFGSGGVNAFNIQSPEAGNLITLRVSPNPFSTEDLMVDFSAPTQSAGTMELYDHLGRLVLRQALPERTERVALELDRVSLSAGVYYLNVRTNEQLFKTQKVMKLD